MRGLPSGPSRYEEFMAGTESATARTMAYPIRWVKLTLPPRVRPRYPLMILRLTSRSLAGTSRNEVAVGTPRLASMLTTIRADAPRRGAPAPSSVPSAAMPVDWGGAGALGAAAASVAAGGGPA